MDFHYREYTKEPLTVPELREVLGKLGVGPRDVLRSRDAKKLEIGDDLADDALIEAMSEHPSLLQRPIAVLGDKAVVGRPHERILEVL